MNTPPIQGARPASSSAAADAPSISRSPVPSIHSGTSGATQAFVSPMSSGSRALAIRQVGAHVRWAKPWHKHRFHEALKNVVDDILSCDDWPTIAGLAARLVSLLPSAQPAGATVATDSRQQSGPVTPASLELLHAAIEPNQPPHEVAITLFVRIAHCSDAPSEVSSEAMELAHHLWVHAWSGKVTNNRVQRMAFVHRRALADAPLQAALDERALLKFVDAALAWADCRDVDVIKEARRELMKLCKTGASRASSFEDRLRYAERALTLLKDELGGDGPSRVPTDDVFASCARAAEHPEAGPKQKTALANCALALLSRLYEQDTAPNGEAYAELITLCQQGGREAALPFLLQWSPHHSAMPNAPDERPGSAPPITPPIEDPQTERVAPDSDDGDGHHARLEQVVQNLAKRAGALRRERTQG